MIQCSKCNKEFDKKENVASISGSIMGDEYIETYYFCGKCGVYTIELCHDRFLGEEEISVRVPVSQSDGDSAIALIKKCTRPWDKKCRCEAHKAYFGDSLD